jgi:DNA-binding NarL/FixJ family response regulator
LEISSFQGKKMTVDAETKTSESHTILIADDHPLFRNALRQAVESQLPNTRVVLAADFNEVEEIIRDNNDADLLLLDLTMPGVSGFIGLIRLRNEHPALPVIMVSASDDPATIRRSLDLGASGFIPKSSPMEQICEAINEVLAGNIWLPENIDIDSDGDDEIAKILANVSKLTPQQQRVLNMIGDGMLNKQIAYSLNVSEATVKAHVSAVLLKLEVDSRTQAVIQFAKLGVSVTSRTDTQLHDQG